MQTEDLENLLGGYATNSLTEEEHQRLFKAALNNQTLFDALADEQALRELLDDPTCRERLLTSLIASSPDAERGWLSSILAWAPNSTTLAWAGSVSVALLALAVVIQLVDDVGPPILLDPKQKLELPPPPQSSYRMPEKERVTSPQPSVPSVSTGTQPMTASSESHRSSSNALKRQAVRDKPISPPQPHAANTMALPEKERPTSLSRKPLAESPTVKEATPVEHRASEEMHGASDSRALSVRNLYYAEPRQVAEPYAPQENVNRQALTKTRQDRRKTSAVVDYEEDSERQEVLNPSLEHEDDLVSDLHPQGQRSLNLLETSALVQGSISKPTRRLGIRYSILQIQPDGQSVEVDAQTVFSTTDALELTVETNQDSYLYVLTPGTANTWRVLFPINKTESSPFAAKTLTRYTLTLPSWERSSDGTRYLRIAFLVARGPGIELSAISPESAFSGGSIERTTPRDSGQSSSGVRSIHSPPFLIQKVRPLAQSPSTEHAVYIVEDRVQPSGPLIATLTLSAG